ncbi:PTPRF-like protein [Mya arenaria]|uniref:protein-tyrosine-phosphatase n=1 Tax=Mya arenaria TaxID=6604 RepID=A0ABY7FBD4_MYAAR|nr:PTPRF-like protein [Mya arenaria]
MLMLFKKIEMSNQKHLFHLSTRLSASSKNKRNGDTTFQAYTTNEENKEPNERTYYNEGQLKRESTNSNPAGTRSPANKPTSQELHTSAYMVTASENEIDLEIDANHDEENTTDVYCNNSVALQNSKISVDVLVQFIDSLTEDDTRAVFEGYKKRKEYIATLGPMSQQLGDEFELFWRMVWQQKVEKIVMVTNLVENATPKCEQYWPNVGTSKMYGEFKITCHSEDMYAEFTRRALTVTRSSEERTLYHLHFTCWPDKGIPDDVTAIIEFRQRVLNTPTTYKGPTVVHCSDGADRTGLFCVVALLLQKMAIEHEVSVLNAVRKVKAMRRLAILNLDQFIFCHESVLEYLRAFDKDVYSNFACSNV